LIRISHEPIKKLIIHDLVHESLDNFLHVSVASRLRYIIWVDGILIAYIALNESEGFFEKSLEGIKIWEKLMFAKYPKYSETIKWNGGHYEIPLLNYNSNKRYSDLAKWLKSQPIWKSNPEVTT